jgi:predicted DCC family thiol-disulfide oxidoreductase YuxK
MSSWSTRPAPDLPDGLVLFDGVCALCSGWVRFLIARDPEGRFRYVSIQSEAGRRLAVRFGIDADEPQTNVVIGDGAAHFKSDSAIAALSGVPRWGWVRAVRILPKRLRDWLYDRVAGNRYRWFGKRETCFMPTPELRRRFIETEAELECAIAGGAGAFPSPRFAEGRG